MLRVVADTNIYVSAFVFGGLPEYLLRLARRKIFLLYLFDAIGEELEEVLTRKFAYSKTALQVVRRKLSRATRRVARTRVRVRQSVDPDDAKVLECALTVAPILLFPETGTCSTCILFDVSPLSGPAGS